MTTPVIRCDDDDLENFKEDRRDGLFCATTAAFDMARRALNYSMQIIPWAVDIHYSGAPTPVYHHVGVHNYVLDALNFYLECRPGALERQEGLEQLRFREHGEAVLCVEADGYRRKFWEVNNP